MLGGMSDEHPSSPALAALTACRVNLRAARIDAMSAADKLTGARASRAAELATRLDDALTHCQRLMTVVTADARYQRLRDEHNRDRDRFLEPPTSAGNRSPHNETG